MRHFHHVTFRDRTWNPRNQANLPDPNSPNSPDFAERHSQTVTELPGGFLRFDVGEPVKRVEGYPQPLPVEAPAAPEKPAKDSPAAPSVPLSDPLVTERDWRGDYGLSKRG